MFFMLWVMWGFFRFVGLSICRIHDFRSTDSRFSPCSVGKLCPMNVLQLFNLIYLYLCCWPSVKLLDWGEEGHKMSTCTSLNECSLACSTCTSSAVCGVFRIHSNIDNL